MLHDERFCPGCGHAGVVVALDGATLIETLAYGPPARLRRGRSGLNSYRRTGDAYRLDAIFTK